jgi:PhoH-like ATPase
MTSQKHKKLFVVDTSVLLYDKNCIKNLSDNDVIIPLIVLEELDKFKSREGILGENSRYFNRFLDDLRSKGSLSEGVYIEDINVNLKVEINQTWDIEGLEKNINDNIILATTKYVSDKYKEEYEKVLLITKDINLRVKCDSIKLVADDYYSDYQFIEADNLFSGITTIECDSETIGKLYSNKFIALNKLNLEKQINENECVVLKAVDSESSSALCMRKFNALELVTGKPDLLKASGIEAKNKEQIFALNLLLNDDIPLVTLTGVPGSGKTYLTLMAALKQIEKEKKKRIIFTRPIQTVGKDIGFLPGTLNEKMAPWLAPIVDNFRNQFGDLTYFDLMMDKGTIDIAPLSYIRGRSFNDAIIIVDEAQNATVHELKTVITRTGKNSKIVLLGDIEQVDLPYVNKFSNGLTIVIEKLKQESLTGHVHFEKGYRSDLANAAAKLL